MPVKSVAAQRQDEFNKRWDSFSWPSRADTLQTEHLPDDVVRQDLAFTIWALSVDDPKAARRATNGISFKIEGKEPNVATAQEAEYLVGFMLSMARMICKNHGILGYPKDRTP